MAGGLGILSPIKLTPFSIYEKVLSIIPLN
jgi:hypothetical protein